MNYRFRKKPIVIEAFQMTPARRAINEYWPRWLDEAWNKNWPDEGAVRAEDYPNSDGTDNLVIATTEGVMRVGWGDWIIKGVAGELYACKPEIFAATYEEVDAAEDEAQAACHWALLSPYSDSVFIPGCDPSKRHYLARETQRWKGCPFCVRPLVLATPKEDRDRRFYPGETT